MMISYKDGYCIILLTAIKLGYSVSFDEQYLKGLLSDNIRIQPSLITTLEKEATTLSYQIAFDGLTERANQVALQF